MRVKKTRADCSSFLERTSSIESGEKGRLIVHFITRGSEYNSFSPSCWLKLYISCTSPSFSLKNIRNTGGSKRANQKKGKIKIYNLRCEDWSHVWIDCPSLYVEGLAAIRPYFWSTPLTVGFPCKMNNDSTWVAQTIPETTSSIMHVAFSTIFSLSLPNQHLMSTWLPLLLLAWKSLRYIQNFINQIHK